MIVSDSTALIILFDLKRVELLENLFKELYITPIVLEEISVKYPIVLPPFMKVAKLEDKELFHSLTKLLDLGESEAIALAKEKNLSLIMDEKKGRKIAKGMGLNMIGLLGVVYLNVKKGFLSKDEALSFLDDALEHGYRISPKMIKDILSAL
jgi:predicted nucleic acid-binding protein